MPLIWTSFPEGVISPEFLESESITRFSKKVQVINFSLSLAIKACIVFSSHMPSSLRNLQLMEIRGVKGRAVAITVSPYDCIRQSVNSICIEDSM